MPVYTCYVSNLATVIALGLRQQIVIPFPVCVSPQIRLLSSFFNDSNVAFFASRLINRIVLVNVGFDFVYRLFSRDAPLLCKIANVCDVFVRALMMRLVNACYVLFCHN